MRCMACDRVLTPTEDARRYKGSGTRVQLCNGDFEHIKGNVEVIEKKMNDETDVFSEG